MTNDIASTLLDRPDEASAKAPFGFAFRTDLGGRYMYDTNTNRILRLSEEQYNAAVARMQPGRAPRTPSGDEAIRRLRSQKLLLTPSVHACDTQEHRGCLEKKISTCLSQLILELT